MKLAGVLSFVFQTFSQFLQNSKLEIIYLTSKLFKNGNKNFGELFLSSNFIRQNANSLVFLPSKREHALQKHSVWTFQCPHHAEKYIVTFIQKFSHSLNDQSLKRPNGLYSKFNISMMGLFKRIFEFFLYVRKSKGNLKVIKLILKPINDAFLPQDGIVFDWEPKNTSWINASRLQVNVVVIQEMLAKCISFFQDIAIILIENLHLSIQDKSYHILPLCQYFLLFVYLDLANKKEGLHKVFIYFFKDRIVESQLRKDLLFHNIFHDVVIRVHQILILLNGHFQILARYFIFIIADGQKYILPCFLRLLIWCIFGQAVKFRFVEMFITLKDYLGSIQVYRTSFIMDWIQA